MPRLPSDRIRTGPARLHRPVSRLAAALAAAFAAPLALFAPGRAGAQDVPQRIEPPSGYVESIEEPGELGGEEDEVDAGKAQVETLEREDDVPGVSARQLERAEKIVVQARKREELLEETPIAVTALGEAVLREAGVTRIDDIQLLVPNLIFQSDNTGAQTNIRIRGVGTSTDGVAFDPGVGIYVDGVFLPRAFGSLIDVVDVQQIEVLRGPQGTLFGKNTVGGAINITTVKPRDDVEGFALVRPGNFERVDTRATLNVPVRAGWFDEKLFTRFSFASTQTPGYVYNRFRDEYLSGRNSLAFLGAIRLLPRDDVTIDLTGTWSRDHNTGRGQQCVVVREDVPLAGLLPDGFYEDCAESEPFEISANVAQITDVESYGTWMTAQWDVGEAGLIDDVLVKSLTSWREQVPRVRFDVDSTETLIVQISGTGGGNVLDGMPGFQRQISEEVQLNATGLDGQIEFVTGAFGFWETATDARTTWVLPPQPGTSGLNQITNASIDISNWTWALYGQATWDVTDWASLTAGLRYTQDKKGLTFVQTDPRDGDVFANDSGDEVFPAWTPMASIALIAPEDWFADTPVQYLMSYFTYSQGFKGGGFNGVVTSRSGAGEGVAFSFEPETLNNFEIGFKTIAWEDLATLNLAFFLGKYDDIQQTSVRDIGDPDGDGVPNIERLTLNAAKATTKGFEIELHTNPITGLQVTGNVGLVDGTYDSWPDALSDLDGSTIDRSGDPFLFVPKWQTFIGVQYSFPLGLEASAPMAGWLTPRLEWGYQSEVRWLGPEVPQGTQPGFNLLNARLSYDFFDDRAQVALWAKNLLDSEYFVDVTPIVSTFGILTRAFAPPRTFGAELSYRL